PTTSTSRRLPARRSADGPTLFLVRPAAQAGPRIGAPLVCAASFLERAAQRIEQAGRLVGTQRRRLDPRRFAAGRASGRRAARAVIRPAELLPAHAGRRLRARRPALERSGRGLPLPAR